MKSWHEPAHGNGVIVAEEPKTVEREVHLKLNFEGEIARLTEAGSKLHEIDEALQVFRKKIRELGYILAKEV